MSYNPKLGIAVHAWQCSDRPNEQLRVGWRDLTEKYPRVWIQTHASDGTEINVDLGFLRDMDAVLAFARFLDSMTDMINRQVNGLPTPQELEMLLPPGFPLPPGATEFRIDPTQETDDSDDEDDQASA